jgi:hypothetical protein
MVYFFFREALIDCWRMRLVLKNVSSKPQMRRWTRFLRAKIAVMNRSALP